MTTYCKSGLAAPVGSKVVNVQANHCEVDNGMAHHVTNRETVLRSLIFAAAKRNSVEESRNESGAEDDCSEVVSSNFSSHSGDNDVDTQSDECPLDQANNMETRVKGQAAAEFR